ncbi:MFS transporter [Streptomyces sp. SID14446]|uniref:MFS transporter n=1 Tax=Streptomyces sp. SID14446 TaxID=2706072 RepID=UPI0013BC38B1|nr:MFS transporter [Streptomyces sp. SID14446]NEB29060.1 MFS transporter [Streptomyces sp. SID14446]
MKSAGILRTNPDFRRFWLSSTLSTLGSQLSLLAFPLLVLSIGGSAAQAGTVATCSLVTRTLLRLPAGHLADRFDRRMIMVGTDLVRLVALASIPLVSALGDLGQAHLLGVAVVEGAATALFAPAATIAVRDVVPEKDLTDALSRSQAAMASSSLIGPFLGGWLFTLDPILPFAADALSYGVSAVLLLRIASRPARQVAGAERDNRLTAGLRWLTHQRALLAALLFAAGINVVSAAAQTAMVVSLRQSGAGGTAIGAVMGCAGVGAMLGAASAPWLIKRIPAARLFLLIGAVWAVGLAVFSGTTQPWTIGPVLVVVVFFSPPAGIVVGRAMLVLAPRDLLGRVSTATGLLMAGLASLGPLLAGSFVDSLGSSHTWLALAGTAAVVTVLSSVPLLRETSLDAVTDDTKKAVADTTKKGKPAGRSTSLREPPAPADPTATAAPDAAAAPAAPVAPATPLASGSPAGPAVPARSASAAGVPDAVGPLDARPSDRAEVMAHGEPDTSDGPAPKAEPAPADPAAPPPGNAAS